MHWLWEVLSKNPFGAGSFLTAITVLVVFQWRRQRKSLSYRIISAESIADIKNPYSKRVKIFFDEKPVNKVHFIVIELANDGWQSIEDNDFSEPVRFSFGEGAGLMTSEVIKCNPKDLKVDIVTQAESFTISPLLLNRGDSMQVKALVDNYKAPVAISGRIKGIPSIKRAPRIGNFHSNLMGLSALGVLLPVFAVMFLRDRAVPPQMISFLAYLIMISFPCWLVSMFAYWVRTK